MLVAVRVVVNPGDLLAFAQNARVHTNQANATQERGGVQVGHVGLQGAVNVGRRFGQDVVQHVKQFLKVIRVRHVAVPGVGCGGFAFPAGCIQDRKIKKGLGGFLSLWVFQRRSKLQQKIMRFFHHLIDAGIGAVGFIHHDDHRHLGRQCFTEYETSLRQGAF